MNAVLHCFEHFTIQFTLYTGYNLRFLTSRTVVYDTYYWFCYWLAQMNLYRFSIILNYINTCVIVVILSIIQFLFQVYSQVHAMLRKCSVLNEAENSDFMYSEQCESRRKEGNREETYIEIIEKRENCQFPLMPQNDGRSEVSFLFHP